ncbi:EBDP2 protein [Verticillium dahliae VdLs.17]|uniref:EBDP2 protein n=1 Tax=Verticillium dahliae (strain VdLs.17 / ATCC MYA-4575 / FGSC 10137) TaxID=498257 RepID=G2X6T5_VERDV|nr:EBDP2 protein [Verticillium dahliae VdLs.17]EGY14703.1 EBDP2 protein [Verticillium dahliae VdLs.17]
MADRDAGGMSSIHPYYPLGIPIPHYAANETPLPRVLVPFVAVLLLPIPIAFVTSRLIKPSLGGLDRFAVCWFALGAFLHCCFEGYFVWNHATLAGLQTLFAQAWKEYALSDSRYLTSDPFVVCVEALSVVRLFCPSSVLSVTSTRPAGTQPFGPLGAKRATTMQIRLP